MFFITPPVPIAPIECAIVRELYVRTNTWRLVDVWLEVKCNSSQSICMYMYTRPFVTDTTCLSNNKRKHFSIKDSYK